MRSKLLICERQLQRKASLCPFSLFFLLVINSHFFSGIGKSLLTAALKDAYERLASEVRVQTLDGVMKPAVELYRSVGFNVAREEKGRDYTVLHMTVTHEYLHHYFDSPGYP